jgi:hypothetical protein
MTTPDRPPLHPGTTTGFGDEVYAHANDANITAPDDVVQVQTNLYPWTVDVESQEAPE